MKKKKTPHTPVFVVGVSLEEHSFAFFLPKDLPNLLPALNSNTNWLLPVLFIFLYFLMYV